MNNYAEEGLVSHLLPPSVPVLQGCSTCPLAAGTGRALGNWIYVLQSEHSCEGGDEGSLLGFVLASNIYTFFPQKTKIELGVF